jgi:hypothetical protein
MNNNHKLYSFLLFVFFISFGLNAQTVSTYFGFNSNVYNPYGLAINSTGDFSYVDQSVWPLSINKINSSGNISTLVNGDYYPLNNHMNHDSDPTIMDYDHSGNLYFIDDMNWPRTIQKVTPDGTVSAFVSDNYNPTCITLDSFGNLYFIDEMNWPYTIQKVTPDGTVSPLFDNSNSNYYIKSMTCDNLGNLYFIDEMNWPRSIQKVTPDGTVSTLFDNSNGDYYIKSATCDNLGNLYFIDEMNWPRSIQKVAPDGTISPYISNDININDPKSFISDNYGNLFFIDYNNGQYKIMTVTNPNYACSTPNEPTSSGTSICGGITTFLSANGIGEMLWYDAPMGGNLIATGNEITTPIINADTTYYVEGVFCNSSSNRTPVAVTVNETPIAVISGDATGNDFVSLTASGIGNYLWSGGYSPTQAVNYFTRTGTYSLTVTNVGGCFNTANVSVIVNKLGINKFGELISDTTLKVNKNGSINAVNYVNKHGKSSSSIADGELNYAVFTAPASYPSNSNDFDSYTNASNQTSSGTYSASLLLDWSNASMLSNASISIPNGGNQFAVQVSGFFIPEESGTYTFTCEGDDAVDLFINGVNVANHYGGHGIGGLGSHTGTINLLEGTKYTFRARMQENGGGEGLRVFWRKPSQSSGWYINTSEISSE